MSQKILKKVLKDEIKARLDNPNYSGFAQHERKTRYKENHIRHADNVLNETPIGEKVAIEGSCPSGTTYCGYRTWDGTDETRREILKMAARYAVRSAGDGWLVRVKDVQQGIFAAQMRTG